MSGMTPKQSCGFESLAEQYLSTLEFHSEIKITELHEGVNSKLVKQIKKASFK